ncbi:hypothetical protein NAT51_01650 [Flavobacterium amniphilum]|uniref:HEAT repeat domain-containing protein n=1 Tax=Flavobacterium amniphilum TaxID=1834035 RepID=UPI00202A2973|nr:HEAT repeat domain-containing protein [Flavobacterium amniphilum]MCL9804211.1 hypothetical protein [Flavobacterium amniphilum]
MKVKLLPFFEMTIETLFKDKTLKPKDKTIVLSGWLLDNSLPVDELISFAGQSKDTVKASCIEAVEYATKENPSSADENILQFVTEALTEKAPRIKWESAKVIGNIAHLFPEQLDTAIQNLLVNTKHEGTVVRWSSAYALGEILKLKTPEADTLFSVIERILEKEEKNSIRKIYLDSIKKITGIKQK